MTNRLSSIFPCKGIDSQDGMTLIEIMISIVLLAFIMFGVVAIIDNSQNTKDRTVQADQDNLSIETAMARLEWDFSQIWSPLYFSTKFAGSLDPAVNPGVEEVIYFYENNPRFRSPSKEGLPIPKFQLKEENDLIFFTTSHRRKIENQRQSNFAWVRYYLGDKPAAVGEGDKDGAGTDSPASGKALLRQIFPDDPWAKEELRLEDTRSTVLLENVESLKFAVWNPRQKVWTGNLTTVMDGESLIRGLQVSITWKDSKGFERSATRWFKPNWPNIPQKAQQLGGVNAGANGGANGGTNAGGTTNGANGGQTNAGANGGSDGDGDDS